MAPEQARDRAVDKRADIWAFGRVLYEMLTGRRAFDGDEVSDVLASVLKSEPDWSRLPADTPPALGTRCAGAWRRTRGAVSGISGTRVWGSMARASRRRYLRRRVGRNLRRSRTSPA